ncbi:methyl-accepting chemotaxis protein [Corallincola holothuriorum]|uniref:Methyl-accepting chemotaxis protein n=2 Tax=Corallincola holothuriorum TaxID=2282215 RepID=A0A368NPE0_9GAMM|nr:methyl-accepting chemotaxis protein [Corallincola holothuriorum]
MIEDLAMSWINNLNFRGKQLFLSSLFVLVLVIVFSVAYSAITALAADSDEISKRLMPRLELLLQADRDLHQAQLAERSLVFVPVDDPSYAEFKKQHQENIKQSGDRMAKFNELSLDTESKQLFDNYLRLRQIWLKSTQQVLAVADDDWEQAKTLSLGEAEQQFQAMRNVVDALTELVEKHANEKVISSDENAESAISQLLFWGIAGAIVCIILALWVGSVAGKSLIHIRDRMAEIADGEGDLSQRLNVSGKDEVAELASTFNRFVGNQSDLIKQIQSLVAGLNDELEQVGSLAGRARQAANEQQGENDQVATAVTEMAASVQEVARNANDAAEATHQADSDVVNGRAVVDQTIGGIEELANNIEQSAEVIQRVENGSRDIGTVMDVISGIAEQTNLLALNAAIEAARAGEQGRGFAVVADEVRTLAQRTQDSTNEIREIIERLQSLSHEAVQAMGESQGRATDLVQHAGQTGQVLEQITAAVQEIAGMNTQIATAAEQQSSTADQISENVVRIKHMAEETDAIAQDVSNSSERVQAQSGDIAGLVNRFKV